MSLRDVWVHEILEAGNVVYNWQKQHFVANGRENSNIFRITRDKNA